MNFPYTIAEFITVRLSWNKNSGLFFLFLNHDCQENLLRDKWLAALFSGRYVFEFWMSLGTGYICALPHWKQNPKAGGKICPSVLQAGVAVGFSSLTDF